MYKTLFRLFREKIIQSYEFSSFVFLLFGSQLSILSMEWDKADLFCESGDDDSIDFGVLDVDEYANGDDFLSNLSLI